MDIINEIMTALKRMDYASLQRVLTLHKDNHSILENVSCTKNNIFYVLFLWLCDASNLYMIEQYVKMFQLLVDYINTFSILDKRNIHYNYIMFSYLTLNIRNKAPDIDSILRALLIVNGIEHTHILDNDVYVVDNKIGNTSNWIRFLIHTDNLDELLLNDIILKDHCEYLIERLRNNRSLNILRHICETPEKYGYDIIMYLVFMSEKFEYMNSTINEYLEHVLESDDIDESINELSQDYSINITNAIDNVYDNIDRIVRDNLLKSFYLMSSLYDIPRDVVEKNLNFMDINGVYDILLLHINSNDDVFNIQTVWKIFNGIGFDKSHSLLSCIDYDENTLHYCLDNCCDTLHYDIIKGIVTHMYHNNIPYINSVINDETPIIKCAKKEFHNIIIVIYSYDPDMSYVDSLGNTAYHYICENMMLPMIPINNSYVNVNGKRPLDLCRLYDGYYALIESTDNHQ